MGEIINYTRLTTSDKLDDRFLTCQVYEPIDPEQVRSGIVFSQIEILNPWFPTSQIGQTVINTLIREYYRGNDSSDLVNFENAIKKVNEALAQIAQNGETEWIGKFSGILALVNGEEVHIAQTGQSQAYLFRGSKVNHITEGLGPNEAPHPLKTFTNLTSGSLQQGDKIIIGNSTLFAVYTPDELRIPITSYRPTLSAIEIARGLKRHGAQNGNAIILELTTKEELANIPPEQKVDTIYLDRGGFDLGNSLRSFGSALAPAFSTIGSKIAKVARGSKSALEPKFRDGLRASQKGFKSLAKSAATLRQNAKPSSEPGTEQASSSIIHRPEISNSHTEHQASNAPTPIKKNVSKLKNRFRRLLISTGLYSSKRSKMIATAIYVIVAVLILTVGYTLFTRSKRANDKNLRDKSAQITSLFGDASVALAKEDENTALAKYDEIVKLGNDLKGTKYEANVKDIIEKAQGKVKEISKLSYIDPGKDYKVDGDATVIKTDDDSLAYFKKSAGIFLKKPLESSFEPFVNKDFGADLLASAPIANQSQTALLLSNKKVALLDLKEKTANEQELVLDGGNKVGEFSSNLYILDPGSNQIWKSINEDGQYKSKSAYLKDNTVISSAVDLAIDGSVYVVNNDCSILKFSRGSKNSEITVNLPGGQKLENCNAIATTESSDSTFIAAQTGQTIKIVEIKKDGEFVGQFALNKSDGTKSIDINAKQRQIIVQTSSQIFTYKI